MALRIQYNSPVVLTFSIIASIIYLINLSTGNLLQPITTVPASFNFSSPIDYMALIFYVFGHANFEHLIGNLSFLLLLGPIMEEKYGSATMVKMIFITAIVTSVLNIVLFHNGLLGASGIVFMLILLVSFANAQKGHIPITFILILALYLGKEIYNSFQNDNTSQFAHIAGGICGGIFGFFYLKHQNQSMKNNHNNHNHSVLQH